MRKTKGMKDEQTEKLLMEKTNYSGHRTESVFSKVLLKSVLRTILIEIKPKDIKETETIQKLLQIKNIS